MTWKNISIDGIAGIEKLVAEFNVKELKITPYGKYKVKIFERSNGKYIGYTNLQLKDEDGCPYAGVGHGDDIESTLRDTINYFQKMITERKALKEEDFECADSFDF